MFWYSTVPIYSTIQYRYIFWSSNSGECLLLVIGVFNILTVQMAWFMMPVVHDALVHDARGS